MNTINLKLKQDFLFIALIFQTTIISLQIFKQQLTNLISLATTEGSINVENILEKRRIKVEKDIQDGIFNIIYK